MRTAQAGGAPVTLAFEGRSVEGRVGETLAAALTAAGVRGLRLTESGAERGVFCGMGVCQDCLLEVDGVPFQRACMTKITGPHQVARQRALVPPEPVAASGVGEFPALTPEIAVIGGGAGGLMAASVAAEAGADVLLIDERPVPGGQFYKQPAGPLPAGADAQFRDGAALIARARRSGAKLLEGASVWGAFAPRELAVTGPAGSLIVRPQRLIVATGAYERPVPVPGWTLPGVMTTGAAQTLLRSYGVLAGKRVLLAGNGPLNLQVATELAAAGAQVVAVAELSGRPSLAALPGLLVMLRADPGLMGRGFSYLRRLRVYGVPVLYRHVLREIATQGDALLVTLSPWDGGLGASRTFTVDAVAMGYGFLPSNEVLRALGCEQKFDSGHRHLATQRDADCLTTTAHVYGVGDCCGLGGAQAAREEGVIAALAALASLGRAVPEALGAEGVAARARLPRHRAFQAALWRLFAAGDPTEAVLTDSTLLCRCEEVSRERAVVAMDDNAPAVGGVKRLTRAGMGRCQGRYCGPMLSAMIAARDGVPVEEAGYFAPRAPIKPVRIADLLRAAPP